MTAPPALRRAVEILAVAATYYASAQIGFEFAPIHRSVPTMWAPAGIAVGLALVLGLRAAPGIALGSLVAYGATGLHPAATLAIAVGNTLEALAAYALIRPNGARILHSVPSVLRFLVVGAFLCPILAATVGTAVLVLSEPNAVPSFGALWFSWWVGNACDILVFAPLVLAWSEVRLNLGPGVPREVWACGALILAETAVAWMVFNGVMPLSYLALPIVAWIAIRFGMTGASVAVAISSAIAAIGTVLGRGPFTGVPLNNALLEAQGFMGTASLTAMLLAALMSERRASAARLLSSQTLLNSIIDNSPAMIVVKDRHGRFLLANQQAARFLSADPALIRGKTDGDFFPPDEAARMRAHDETVIEAETSFEWEETVTRADGVHTYLSLKFPLRGADGRVQGVCGLSTNITERKKTEETLRRFKEELEERVRERTAELEKANVRLRVSNDELESFSYTVSHDLRAPLRTIDGFCSALLEDYAEQLDERGRDYLQRASAASRRMAQMIEDLLGLSRVSRGEISPAEVDLSAMVKEIVADLHERFPDREVALHVDQGVVATADPRLVRIALTNLLDNAWKFTSRKEHPEVSFRAIRDGATTKYCVEDNGAGFEMNYADKLFKPFARLHSWEEFQGTGIGLATVRRIVERHGGEVYASGQVGEGARFCFTLGQGTAAAQDSARERERVG